MGGPTAFAGIVQARNAGETGGRTEGTCRRSLGVPEMPAARALSREGSAGKAAGVSKLDVLGQAGSWIRKFERATAHSGSCPCGAWSKPHGAHVYWRSLGRFLVRGAAQSRLRESVHFPGPRRWIAAERRVYQRDMPMRPA